MHLPGQIYSFVVILLGNSLYWQVFFFEINRQQLFLFRCSTFNFSFKVEEGRVHSCKDKITPLDYTPFFYLIMAETTFISVLLPILLNPKLKRSKTDEKD